MADDEMYLDNLDEFINDENKLVTYKWLSRTLQVHVNVAKQMLFTFKKKHETKLNVTYLVAGVAQDVEGKVHKVQVVPAESLDAAKAALDVVTSCHVYSVQKSKLKDAAVLYTADFDLTKENLMQANKFSAIQCPSAKPRSECELEKLRHVAQPTTTASDFSKPVPESTKNTKTTKKKADIGSMFATQKNKKLEKKEVKESVEKTTAKKKEVKESVEKTTAKKKEVKESGEKTTVKTQQNAPAKSKAKPKKQGGLQTLFANQAAKPKVVKPKEKTEDNESDEKKEIKEIEKEQENKSPQSGSKAKKSNDSRKEIKRKERQSPRKDNKGKNQTTKSNNNNRNRRKNSQDNHDEGIEKKRRRIQNKVWSDSSSSSSEGEDEEEEEEIEVDEPTPVCASDNESVSPEPTLTVEESEEDKDKEDKSEEEKEDEAMIADVQTSSGKRRKRIKKLVSKTHVDDDGFIVTEKLMESASETDQSEAEEVKAPPPSAKAQPPSAKASPPSDKAPRSKAKEKKTVEKKSPLKTGRKQANIMSFFKKK